MKRLSIFIAILFLIGIGLIGSACSCGDDDDDNDDAGDDSDDDSGDDTVSDDTTVDDTQGDDDTVPPPFDIVTGDCRLVWYEPGDYERTSLGQLILPYGDFNDDSIPDAVVVSSDPFDLSYSVIEIRAGQTGEVLDSFKLLGYVLGMALVDDLDEDGYAEVALGIQEENTIMDDDSDDDDVVSDPGYLYRLSIYSPEDGALIWEKDAPEDELELGSSVARAFDYDEDGVSDLIVGSPFPDEELLTPGKAHILSGVNGDNLLTIDAPVGASESFGDAVGQGVDIDGDGLPDVLVSDPRGPTDYYGAGTLGAFAWDDAAELWVVEGSIAGSAPDLLGDSFEPTGDLNEDGGGDVIIGLHWHYVPAVGDEGVGQVQAVDGLTGDLLWSVDGRRLNENFGVAVNGPGDVNGDGVLDVLVGAPAPPFPLAVLGLAGRFAVLSGDDGTIFFDVEGIVGEMAGSDFLGQSLAGIGDITGDGLPEFMVGAPDYGADGANFGMISVWTCGAEE